jgi:hypothetical protein
MITLYWCRKLGQFVNKETGQYVTGAQFRGNNLEWYETLTEVVLDGIARTNADRILLNNPTLAILSMSVLYMANLARPTGSEPLGTLHRHTPVYPSGIRAIPLNEIWLLKGNEPVARVVVLELGVQ